MINLVIFVNPDPGKKIEFGQTIKSIQNNLDTVSHGFELLVEGDNYKFSFHLETKEELDELLQSFEFTILSGAIQTLCHKPTVILNNRKIFLESLNFRNISRNRTYKSL